MTKLKLKTGDTVKVISGDHKGEEGKIVEVFIAKKRAIVEGVNMISKHTKPSAENPQGGIIKKEAPVHISNLMLVENGKTIKVGYRMDGDKKVRFSKESKEVI